MKPLLRAIGILLLVCGICLYLIAGYIQEEARPRTVTFGAMTNGVYTQTGSGTIGGSNETVEDMQWLKGIAIMSGVMGMGTFTAAALIRDKEKPDSNFIV